MAIKLRALVKHPSRLEGATGLLVEKENGVYTVSLNMGEFADVDTVADQDASYFVLITPGATTDDPDTNELISITNLLNLLLSGNAALTELGNGSSTGFWTITGAGTGAARTFAVGSGLSITNAAGQAGNPTISLNITGLTEDTTPDAANDLVVTYDNSAAAYKKVKLTNAVSAASPGVGSFIARTGSVVAQADDYASLAGAGAKWNHGLSASVAANALTITLTDAAGSTPSSTSPAVANFRSSTASTGTVTARSTTSSHTLVVPSGAELGVVANEPFHLYVLEIDDGGTKRLGVIRATSSTSFFPLRASGLITSTTIGTGSDSAGVAYAGTGSTSKPYVVLGRLSWTANPLATPGAWANGPDVIEVAGPDFLYPGELVQSFVSSSGALTTGTTLIPLDATIPQNTEGDQYFSQAITPTSHANWLIVEAELAAAHSVASWIAAALFKDSAADAIATGREFVGDAATGHQLEVKASLVAGSVSSQTFKVRAGGINAGTFSINGNSTVNYFNGTMKSFLRVSELQG